MKTIYDVPFTELYRNHFSFSQRKPKTASEWDSKAEKMQATDFDRSDDYIQAFISKMDLVGNESLLDVGCGGGAISLAVADKVKQIYALDHSPKMLELVRTRANLQNIHNIQPLVLAWEDDWSQVPEVDICVSSRSSMVPDLELALAKLNAKAKKAVYMTMTVEKDFIVRDVLQYIGRESVGFPSYIYAVNILHQQGYRVKVDFIETKFANQPERKSDLADFIKTVQWSIGQLSEQEITKLTEYYQLHQGNIFARNPETTWAFLSWSK
ncbi:methyltransferase domain-containing protein [Mannheimia sp. AT1]|uniref:Methyltransferase domain-containing protein n=1 Tax=Mannheimia cairinae TaxID=3025936 RepID=A0ABT5MQ96_9PAST|nr:methyltransferase domain-containing protein [Mannheimia cairinae]MDD0823659.1 methyltransferase domain-containing protein [Mannheimia cairinae]MDD0825409.1 methyltransferase domain-containing protein [Mannheimia cairinae]